MTDRERFEHTFSHLRASDELFAEVMNMTVYEKKRGRAYSRRVVALAAAVVAVLALGVTAYATDLFGFRALEVPESAGQVSISQPQEVAPGLDPVIGEKVELSRQAWSEWESYRENNAPEQPVPFRPENEPEGTTALEAVENPDGSYTIIYLVGVEEAGRLIITAEEYNYMVEYMDAQAKGYDGYDWNYRIRTAADAMKLEEIAGKYGLALRGPLTVAYSSETAAELGMPAGGANYYTNAELCELTATEMGNGGNIFRSVPVGFDKVYWFDEGTFAVSFYVDLPSGGRRLTCYSYNSMYSTLSSGREVMGDVNKAEFNSREYTTADGTVLSVLENSTEAYLYVFLENSFFAQHIYAMDSSPITQEDVNHVADYLNYHLISQ